LLFLSAQAKKQKAKIDCAFAKEIKVVHDGAGKINIDWAATIQSYTAVAKYIPSCRSFGYAAHLAGVMYSCKAELR
jgi:hypothetical protein